MRHVARIVWAEGKAWKWYSKRDVPAMWQELADLKMCGFSDAHVV